MGNEQPESSWIGKQKEQIRQDINGFSLKDCSGCRYIGGVVMILAGSYVGYVGQRRVALRGGGTVARIPSAVVAGLMLSLGIMRLAGRNPFSSSGSEVGIDLLHTVLPTNKSDDSAPTR